MQYTSRDFSFTKLPQHAALQKVWKGERKFVAFSLAIPLSPNTGLVTLLGGMKHCSFPLSSKCLLILLTCLQFFFCCNYLRFPLHFSHIQLNSSSQGWISEPQIDHLDFIFISPSHTTWGNFNSLPLWQFKRKNILFLTPETINHAWFFNT